MIFTAALIQAFAGSWSRRCVLNMADPSSLISRIRDGLDENSVVTELEAIAVQGNESVSGAILGEEHVGSILYSA